MNKKLLVLVVLILIAVASWYWALHPTPVVISGTRLEFVPMGKTDPALVRTVAEQVAKIYAIPCRVESKALPPPQSAYSPARKQYLAPKLLVEIEKRPVAEKVHRLVICDQSITMQDMNFLFGLADPPKRTAVMSTANLKAGISKRDPARGSKLLDRCVKIAAHELGHTYGFEHCDDELCLMSFSNTGMAVDNSRRTLCERCGSRVR